jgi:hypothetical protein
MSTLVRHRHKDEVFDFCRLERSQIRPRSLLIAVFLAPDPQI